MFFHRNYQEPGPGILPDAPEKTGAARLFEILQLECVTLVKLNLLFLLSCLPLVTVPPALYAMNHVVRRMVLDQPVDCAYHYWTAFRRGWKAACGAFFLLVLPLGCAGYGAFFYLRLAGKTPLLFLPFMLCSTVFLAALLASFYLYGLLTSGRSLRAAARTALLLGIAKPLRAAAAALCGHGLLLAAVLTLPLSALYLLLLGPALSCLLGHFFVRTVLRQCLKP